MQDDFENNFDKFFGANVEHLRFPSSSDIGMNPLYVDSMKQQWSLLLDQ